MNSKNKKNVKESGTKNFDAASYVRRGLTVDEVNEIKEAFDLFDTENSGAIQLSSLLASMESLGFKNKNPDIYKMISEIEDDEDAEGEIKFQDFLDMMTGRISEKNPEEDLSRVYKLFDFDRKGEIDFDSLKKVALDLGEDISDEELKEIITRAGADYNGKFTKDAFLSIMMKK